MREDSIILIITAAWLIAFGSFLPVCRRDGSVRLVSHLLVAQGVLLAAVGLAVGHIGDGLGALVMGAVFLQAAYIMATAWMYAARSRFAAYADGDAHE